MPDEKQPEQTKSQPGGGGGQSRGGGGGGRPSRKPLLHRTNLIALFLWLLSAFLTSIVGMLVFIQLPASCLGQRGELLGPCVVPLITSSQGLTVFLGATVVQFIISSIIAHISSRIMLRIGNAIEALINFIGLFWLFCIQLDMKYAQGMREQVLTLIRNFTVGTLILWIILCSLSIGWNVLIRYFHEAPATGGTSARR
jgi:hypothetical protein